MLGINPIPLSCNSHPHTTFPLKLPSFLFHFSPNRYHVSNSLLPSFSVSSSSLHHRRTGLSISASKNHTTSKSFTEIDDDESEHDEEDEDEEEEEEEGGGEKMMLMMGFDEMQRWFRNRPPGFGEGKTYDTSIEEELMEEMEQSRKAQLANINKLKNSPPPKISPKKNQEMQMKKAPEAVPSGIQVRVGNLPKKRNIHRDLQSAFKEFPGIVNISPAVSGNRKTRDPICKGFAFLYLESEKAAQRFVQLYSKQNIQFGKIQKQITCEITNPTESSETAAEQSTVSTYMPSPQLRIPDAREETDADSDMDNLTWDSREGMFSEGSAIAIYGSTETSTELIYITADEPAFSDTEVIEVGIEDYNISERNNKDSVKPRNEGDVATGDSISLKQRQKNRVVRKVQIVKEKSDKERLNVPSSVKRLKIKDRAVLTGVFSKYGGKANSGKS